uniref:Protein kinase-like domain, concanavalin A-like lectin/glucanase domain protein n=1 Tax=Tanacetum cinerariifolium TaxID=118510 RepID=A0A699GT06_TANCI|nr:protein kinase-like domain, concanavalin A-like lectin/glucanase domain protein [Tanacetum cinerariifolium]
MGDVNPIRTLRDYSKPSHKGYMNTIEIPVRNNVVPLQSDTIRGVTDTFFGNKNEDAHDHVDRVLNIMSLFNILGVSQDMVVRVFSFTLAGFAIRWVDRLTPRVVNTWDLLKNPLSKGNFTNDKDFMIVEDIHSIIDPRLSQVVLGKPFIEISNMTHDLPEGVARFTNENDEIAYKMPYKIEQYNSLSDSQKEHTKSVYLRNEDDNRRGVEYVMSKILGFYKECLKLGPKYVTRMDNKGEVTKFLIKTKKKSSQFLEMASGLKPDGVASPAM